MALPSDFLEGTAVVRGRPEGLPEWERGAKVDGWGDRGWTQKRDMFEVFMLGSQD